MDNVIIVNNPVKLSIKIKFKLIPTRSSILTWFSRPSRDQGGSLTSEVKVVFKQVQLYNTTHSAFNGGWQLPPHQIKMANDNDRRRRRQWVLKSVTVPLCIIIILVAVPTFASEDKSGIVGDSTSYDIKDRDRLTSVFPFGEENGSSSSIVNSTQLVSNISTLMNKPENADGEGNKTPEVPATSTTTTTTAAPTTTTVPPEPLIPKATVNANIAQMNSGSKKKGQIIIR